MATSHVKFPPPRQLANHETSQSLLQWRTNFKQYFKREDSFKHFIASTTTWNPTAENYGFTAAAGGRTAAQFKEDCVEFLHVLASHLPHGYLTEKITTTATSLQNAFEIIAEHYNVNPTQETFLDFDSLSMETGESYRQFFERLVGHARQHFSPAGSAVDNTTVPGDGDTMTVSHLNMIALWWMRKIHVDLISVVRTEYAVELRNNKPLASLVPRISANVDSLLQRYDKSPAVNMVMEPSNQTSVLRLRGKTNKPNPTNVKKGRKEYCPGCFYLGDKMDADIHYQHRPDQCPRKPALVKMLQLEDLSIGECEQDTDSNEDLGKKSVPAKPCLQSPFQDNKLNPEDEVSHSCSFAKCSLVSSFIRKVENKKYSKVLPMEHLNIEAGYCI